MRELLIVKEAKEKSWKFLLPVGAFLTLAGGVFSFFGIFLLVMGIIDLVKKFNKKLQNEELNLRIRKISKILLIFLLVVGLPLLVVTNLLVSLQVFIFIILAIFMIFLVMRFNKSS